MVRRFDPPPPRKKSHRSLLRAAKGLLLPMGAVVVLFMAAAASTSTLWEQIASGPDEDTTRPQATAQARANAPSMANSAGSPRQTRQDQMSLAIALAGPTSLGAFSSGSTKAPVLEGAFLMASAKTSPPASAPIIVAEVTPKPVEIPLPFANPFRLQAPAPAPVVLATREAPPAARSPAAARRTASQPAPSEKGFFESIFGASEPQPTAALAYAPTDQGDVGGWRPAAPPRRTMADGKTALYDISSKTVLLPNGQRLEAHSGLGDLLDDPRSMHLKNRGVTPANVYNLRLRESLFHGVRAIRLIPVNGGRMFGRDGILAHTFMLGPRGDSNGCVSFRDYDAFLQAFLRGEITRIAVAETTSSALALAMNIQ